MTQEDAPATHEAFNEKIVSDDRPWGNFRQFPLDGVKAVKILTVVPGGTLSLQYHHKRSEFWKVLDPGLEVTLGDRVWEPDPGEEIWIPQGATHRLRGVGDAPGRIFELWIGDSEESDIVRVEDVYDRS